MENRLIIAYALCAMMVLVFAAVAMRYVNSRKQFKIRQSGRGKSSNSDVTGGVPAE